MRHNARKRGSDPFNLLIRNSDFEVAGQGCADGAGGATTCYGDVDVRFCEALGVKFSRATLRTENRDSRSLEKAQLC